MSSTCHVARLRVQREDPANEETDRDRDCNPDDQATNVSAAIIASSSERLTPSLAAGLV
jgi:hypothetical protein